MSEARDEILSGIAPQGHVTETITGDALEDFQEAAEQANAISVQPEPQPWNGIDGLLNNKPIMPEATPTERANALIDWAERDGQRMGNEERRLIVEYAETVGDTDKVIELINRLCEQGYEMQHGHMDDFVRSQIESEIAVAKAEQQTALDPAAEPVVMILFTESPHLEMGQQMPLHEADALFARLDAGHRGGGYYDKTDFRIDFTFQGEPHSYSGRQDFGDRDGSLIEHIREYQTFYLNDEKWKDHLTRQGGPEAWAEDHASREAFLTEIIPYMELHCNLSRLEQEAQTRLASSDTLTPEETAYYGALVDYAMECRPLLNHGEPLPEMPKLTDFDQSLQDYKAQVEAEIAQEAADAGMTVEEYAAAGYEAPAQPQEVKEPPQQEAPEQQTKEPAASDYYYSINEGAARRAKEMNSFSDYKPGSATAEYRHYVDEAFALAQEQKRRVDPMYHEKIDSLLDTYARKLAANMNKGYEIDARVPSILIAGGSNFPTRKKEKQNAARDSNYREWQDIQGLLDKIRSTGMGGISADDPQAVQKLEKKLESLEKSQETMKAVNAYYRKHKTLDGCPHLPPEELEKLKADMASSWHLEDKPFATWALSNNSAEIRRVKDRIKSLSQQKEIGFVGWEFDGGKVEANTEANRLQIFFEDKPDEATREALKSNGFRWSPKAGAWQRQLTSNAYYAADYVKAIAPLTGEKPTELQRAHIRQQKVAAQEQPAQEQPEQEAPQDKDTFSIYQIKGGDETRDLRFEPYDRLIAAGHRVDPKNYALVYSAPLTPGTSLEDIYTRFNIDHPKDFKGHSLSVSDVVVLHQNGQDTAHYVDSFGYKKVPEFLQPENYLKTAEQTTEQNYNMIDGQINNTPTVAELEAKVKTGETISLVDLAETVKADKERGKAAKTEKKPSIRAQLKAAKEQTPKKQAKQKTQDLERS